jgi:hypothetical protein
MNKTINNMKKILITFIISLAFRHNKTKGKSPFLDQVTQSRNYKNIVIDFKYSLSNENINQDSKGNVTMKNNQYVLNFMGITKIFDGRKPHHCQKMKRYQYQA